VVPCLHWQELEHPAPPGLSEEELESRDEQREKLRIVKTVLEQVGWLLCCQPQVM